jgi:hypothetical protein
VCAQHTLIIGNTEAARQICQSRHDTDLDVTHLLGPSERDIRLALTGQTTSMRYHTLPRQIVAVLERDRNARLRGLANRLGVSRRLARSSGGTRHLTCH